MRIGVACSAGSYQGVFVHGVLAGLNERGFKVDIYAASSSTTTAAAYAAAGDLPCLKGPEHWRRMYAGYLENDHDVSKAVLEAIPEYTRRLQHALFGYNATRLAVAVSAEVGPLYRDFFQSKEVPTSYLGAHIHLIRPKRELADRGVDFMKVADEGLHLAYELGVNAGEEFAESCALSSHDSGT